MLCTLKIKIGCVCCTCVDDVETQQTGIPVQIKKGKDLLHERQRRLPVVPYEEEHHKLLLCRTREDLHYILQQQQRDIRTQWTETQALRTHTIKVRSSFVRGMLAPSHTTTLRP